MKQSNFSLTDEQLKDQFPILAQPASTKMFVAAIGDPFTTPNGDTQIPVMLVQKANRFNNGDDFASVARGWGSRILRKIENFTESNLKALEVKIGSDFKGYDISLVRTLKPSYEGQSPIVRRDGTAITSNGQEIYQTTVITAGGPKDVGMDIVYDTVDVTIESVRV